MGKGYTMQQAMDEVKMVVEGVYSAKAAKSLAEKYNVEMPIIMEVNKVLFENKSASDAVRDLMIRDKKVVCINMFTKKIRIQYHEDLPECEHCDNPDSMYPEDPYPPVQSQNRRFWSWKRYVLDGQIWELQKFLSEQPI